MVLLDQTVLSALQRGILESIPDVQAVYLFGSAARGELREDSDIDLAFWTQQSLSSTVLWKLRQELAIIARRDVDLIELKTASAVLKMQVLMHGKRIMCRDFQACEQFEDFCFADYARLNEERQYILQDVQQRGSIYG
ncbi:MAG: nucleotidyltransferase domain-containing protein [Mariprofundaceae bacterium]